MLLFYVAFWKLSHYSHSLYRKDLLWWSKEERTSNGFRYEYITAELFQQSTLLLIHSSFILCTISLISAIRSRGKMAHLLPECKNYIWRELSLKCVYKSLLLLLLHKVSWHLSLPAVRISISSPAINMLLFILPQRKRVLVSVEMVAGSFWCWFIILAFIAGGMEERKRERNALLDISSKVFAQFEWRDSFRVVINKRTHRWCVCVWLFEHCPLRQPL